MEEEQIVLQTTVEPSIELDKTEKSETTPPSEVEVVVVEDEQNGNCNQTNANKNNVNLKNNNRVNNYNVKNKKLNNRRRKRSYRSRKNSRSGNNFKFNPKLKNRDVMFDQARRHQLFFSDSQRLVPYNTNEFLMDDHYPKISPNFNYNPSTHDSLSSSDCGMSGSIDEDEFLTKEFRMDYENLRSEQLHEMTKEQLIQEYVKLENQTELSIKSKENDILALNNKIKELTRRLKHKKNTQQKVIDGVKQFSSDSSSSDSDSDSRSSSSSSSSSDSVGEDEEADQALNGVNDFPVITDALEQQAKLAETVSC